MRTDYALLSISTLFATMIYFTNTISQKKNFKSSGLKYFYRVLNLILGKKKCPICLEFAKCYSLENCKHPVCSKCFENYLDDKLKNITEYPLKCHEYNCKELLHAKDIDYYLKNSPVNTREEKLKIYNKFSKLYLIPANLRIVCSQCDHVMSKAMFEKYYNTIFNNNTQNTNVLNDNNDKTTNTNNNTDNTNNSNNNNNNGHTENGDNSNANNDNNNINNDNNNANANANNDNNIDNSNSENNEPQLNLSARWNHTKCEDCDETFSLLKDANNCRYCGKLFCPGCIHDNSVCYDCNLSIFSLSCKNCNTLLCIECEQLWHKNDSTISINNISNIKADNNNSDTNTNNNTNTNTNTDNNTNNNTENIVNNDNNAVNNNIVDNNLNDTNNVNAQSTDTSANSDKKKKMKINDSHICNSILNKNKDDIETKELIKSLLYCYCPGCSMIIEKIDGCNHVTHVYCSIPKCVSDDDNHEIIVSSDGNTHFCYCCGDLISPNYMDTEHITHFPYGSSEPCRKVA